ncbi:MAG: cytochrome c-type biogenesis protein CcmH [Acidimicrobiales bacterium]
MTTAAISSPTRSTGFARLAASRWAWAILVIVAAAALSFGSVHSRSAGVSARTAYLDSVIKCPSCEDVSIAQSDAGVATALRAEVRRLVERGWSDQRIEEMVVAQYGAGEILAPSSDLAWLIPLVVGAFAAAAIGVGLLRSRKRRGARASAEEEELVAAAMRHLEENPWAT